MSAIRASKPVTIPARTFDQYWLRHLRLRADAPARPVSVDCILAPYRTDEAKGEAEIAATGHVRLQIRDLFADATEDAELQSVMDALLTKVEKLATAKGLI